MNKKQLRKRNYAERVMRILAKAGVATSWRYRSTPRLSAIDMIGVLEAKLTEADLENLLLIGEGKPARSGE